MNLAEQFSDSKTRRTRGHAHPQDELKAVPAQEIPLELVDTGENPRLIIDEGLKTSLERDGLLQPIVVERSGLRYTLIAGERRFAAARALKWENIDARVFAAGHFSPEARPLIRIIENVAREDLPDYDMALAIFRYKNQMRQAGSKITNNLLANALSGGIGTKAMTPIQIRDKFTHGKMILSLDPELRHDFLRNISTAKFLEVRSRPLDEQLSLLKGFSEGVTVSQARQKNFREPKTKKDWFQSFSSRLLKEVSKQPAKWRRAKAKELRTLAEKLENREP